jgi:hypothetical protein
MIRDTWEERDLKIGFDRFDATQSNKSTCERTNPDPVGRYHLDTSPFRYDKSLDNRTTIRQHTIPAQ